MRRWPSQPTNVGVVSMSFMLPFLPKEGWWTIRALVNGQTQDKKIRVTKWYTPRFEVGALFYSVSQAPVLVLVDMYMEVHPPQVFWGG